MSRLLAPILAALALTAVGCGGGVAAEPGAPAGIVPAAATGVVSVDLERLGDVPALRSAAAEKLRGHGIELEELGDEAVLVALGARDVVVLSRLEEAPAGAAAREVDGWTALAESEAVLDRYEAALAAGTIEGSEPYRAAAEEWPSDALVTAFVRGDALAGALRERLGSLVPSRSEAEWLTAAAVVEDDTLRVTGLARGGAGGAEPVPAGLLDRVPAGATAVLAFGPRGPHAELEGALPEAAEPLLALASGGGVIAYGPGLLEVSAVLASDDPEAALRSAAQALGGQPEGDGYRFGLGGFTVLATAEEDAVVATTSGAAPRAGGPPEALGEAPEEATALLYADVERLLPLASMLGERAGPTDVESLPIRRVAAWTYDEGEDARFVLTAGLR